MASTLIRKMSSSTLESAIKHVTVIGGGLMGSGIAQVTAAANFDVTIVDVDYGLVKKAREGIENSLIRVSKKKFKDNESDQKQFIGKTLDRIKGSTDLNETVKKTDLVIEAIIENMSIKHKLFESIDKIAPNHTIFTSNTSSLSIAEIASITSRKDRFGGLHFFNPVPIMRLLEIIRTEDTSDMTFTQIQSFGEKIGKTCITCKDTPGFVVNRLLVPYMAESIRLLQRGVASARDIDIAMKLGAGYPMGPIELADYVGLDTTYNILNGWHENDPENPIFKPLPILENLVRTGKLGVKSGEGFYKYEKN